MSEIREVIKKFYDEYKIRFDKTYNNISKFMMIEIINSDMFHLVVDDEINFDLDPDTLDITVNICSYNGKMNKSINEISPEILLQDLSGYKSFLNTEEHIELYALVKDFWQNFLYTIITNKQLIKTIKDLPVIPKTYSSDSVVSDISIVQLVNGEMNLVVSVEGRSAPILLENNRYQYSRIMNEINIWLSNEKR